MSVLDLSVREQYVPTEDGWNLHLKRTISPVHFDPSTRPLCIVPGYGMNSFIFGYHPRGTSIERCLAEGGYEVWALDLRGVGFSRPLRPQPGRINLSNYCAIDLPAGIRRILATTKTGADDLVLIGCSLGGSVVYGALGLDPTTPGIAGVIAMGAPLRWIDKHPLMGLLFASPRLVGMVRLTTTRRWARRAVPLLQRVPGVLSMYMNSASIDLSHLPQMIETVENPQPEINREIAVWLKEQDLSLNGVNITEAMRQIDLPLLVVLSNRDGIVPETTALSVVDVWGSPHVQVLEVGDADNWYAHANLFIADDAPTIVFEPIIRWLRQTMSLVPRSS